MPNICISCRCASTYVRYHTFPTQPDRKKEWEGILGLSNVGSHVRICSQHFRTTDYKTAKLTRLKDDALPRKLSTPVLVDQGETSDFTTNINRDNFVDCGDAIKAEEIKDEITEEDSLQDSVSIQCDTGNEKPVFVIQQNPDEDTNVIEEIEMLEHSALSQSQYADKIISNSPIFEELKENNEFKDKTQNYQEQESIGIKDDNCLLKEEVLQLRQINQKKDDKIAKLEILMKFKEAEIAGLRQQLKRIKKEEINQRIYM